MKTVMDESSRSEILSRIDRVSASAQPRWGKMNPERMLAHLVEAGRMAIGEVVCKPKKIAIPIRYFPIKQLVLYVFPFPKGAPTARELLPSDPGTMERSRNELARVLAAMASKTSEDGWPDHPAFGKLTRTAWGKLTYKHFDHHLRQFGV